METPISGDVEDIWEFSVKLKALVQKNPTNWHDLRRLLEIQVKFEFIRFQAVSKLEKKPFLENQR